MNTKRCDRCSRDLSRDASNFSRRPDARDGFEGICKSCRNKARNRNHIQKRAQINERQRSYREGSTPEAREVSRIRARAWYEQNAERAKARIKASNRKLKAEMIAAYGGICSCCGEDNAGFLTLDHVENDGAIHRREAGNSQAVWRKLREKGWPKVGLTILCYNCNCGRAHNGGICPHQENSSRFVCA